jgi:hypothetical protein
VLFAEGWKRKRRVREILGWNALLSGGACHLRDAGLDEVRALEEKQDVILIDE